jgi:hypothetical protein
MADWLLTSRLRSWNRIPELAHLPADQRREFWAHCRAHTEIKWTRAQIVTLCVLAIAVFVVLLGGVLVGGYPLGPALLAAVLLAVMQLLLLSRWRRQQIRSALNRDLLAQFFGRQLPAHLQVHCPECGYNLGGRLPGCTMCPECGATINRAT